MKLNFGKIFEKNPQFLLFAEYHGVRENLEIFSQAINFYIQKNKPIVIALEWPERLSKELNDYILGKTGKVLWREWEFSKNPDGRLSKEFLEFLEWVRKQTIAGAEIIIACTDKAGEFWTEATWNERDRWMGKNILKAKNKSPKAIVIGIFGNIHANKNKLRLNSRVRIPAAHYLPRKETVSIKLKYLEGSFFNVGLRKIETEKQGTKTSRNYKLRKIIKGASVFNNGFDYEILIPKATPIKLLGNFNPKTGLVEI